MKRDLFYLFIKTVIIQPLHYILFSLLLQLGTLGAGNHYAEIQVVDEIYDKWAAAKMGIEFKGQICVMIHSGSRGFGHQVATGIAGFYKFHKLHVKSRKS